MVRVKTENISRMTLESMNVGDAITFILPDYSKVESGRTSITIFSNRTGKCFTTSNSSETKNELTVTRTK